MSGVVADSRAFVERVLFSGQAEARGLTRQSGVLRMWREQLGGAHHARSIGALLTLELWCRAFLDGELPSDGAA